MPRGGWGMGEAGGGVDTPMHTMICDKVRENTTRTRVQVEDIKLRHYKNLF